MFLIFRFSQKGGSALNEGKNRKCFKFANRAAFLNVSEVKESKIEKI